VPLLSFVFSLIRIRRKKLQTVGMITKENEGYYDEVRAAVGEVFPKPKASASGSGR
jgi:hypothetical protein